MNAGSQARDAHRIERTRAVMAGAGVDLLLATPGADLRWLTGHAPPALERLTCLALPVTGTASLVVPMLERAEALECAAVTSGAAEVLAWQETEDPFVRLTAAVLAALGREPRRVAVTDRMWAEQVLRFEEVFATSVVGTAGPLLRALRVRKDAAEITALGRAAAAIDRVHARMGEWLRPGRTEREIAADVAAAIVAEGHSSVNFVIVGSGPNGASPHARPGDRVVATGDAVVVDIGGTMPDGYCSDCTRTYVVGRPDPEFVAMYDVLRLAQAAGVDAVRPGATAEQIDRAARGVIEAAGYGDRFVHRTGHGIGLDEHEEPWIVAGDDTVLEPGMTFSVEPGIYLPGRFGARIEDIVAVTPEGGISLDTVTRDLVVL